MKVLVIDGMGGGMGKAVIEGLRSNGFTGEIAAAGANGLATAAMIKAGASYGATGENAVLYNCQDADFIIGVMGIVFGNSMHGEISPKMAEAVALSRGHKILIPVSHKCNATVLGISEKPINHFLNEIIKIIHNAAAQDN